MAIGQPRWLRAQRPAEAEALVSQSPCGELPSCDAASGRVRNLDDGRIHQGVRDHDAGTGRVGAHRDRRNRGAFLHMMGSILMALDAESKRFREEADALVRRWAEGDAREYWRRWK